LMPLLSLILKELSGSALPGVPDILPSPHTTPPGCGITRYSREPRFRISDGFEPDKSKWLDVISRDLWQPIWTLDTT
jgi:hypothetical protein